ncbi:NAD(P)H-dependent oxidoreductase [Nesterenkonia rhizosphaerae]|uniref:NAD(P)H-dependent oxidoreductase n=1 Tax=Nesterenkonia rhizosphaerae TaxID=1348272 RepID=A0ABP9FVQ1_9MICC
MTKQQTILWVSAHPEPKSLTHQLRRDGIAHLRSQGYEVLESDLYTMNWDPVVRPADGQLPEGERFRVSADVRQAYLSNALPAELQAEHEKILRADVLLVQFPLWWYGMPAILKGWFDRLFVSGFAFGTDPETGKRLRYEQGPFTDKRALVLTTLGDRPASIGPRGKSGEITELLHGILHGTFAYTGMSVLKPWALPSADFTEDYQKVRKSLLTKLDELHSETPIPYRPQFTGQYSDQWELVPEISPGETGLSIHIDNTDLR